MNNNLNSSIMKLEALDKEYTNILTQYEQAYSNYTSNLTQDVNGNTNTTPSPSYQIMQSNGSNNTYCRGDGWDQNGWPKQMGYLTDDKCAAECDNATGCVAYDIARPNANGEYDCYLFGNSAVAPEYDSTLESYGCHQKISNSGLTSSTTPQEIENSFTALQGKTFWGTSGLKEGAATSQEECESMCLSDQTCSGATFNTDKQYCWTRSGDGITSSGLDTDYALIPKTKQSINVLKNLNQKLLDTNSTINQELNNLYPIAQEEIDEKNKKQQQLNKSYSSLLKEQKEIEKMLQVYETLEEELDNNIIYVNQQNSSLKFWLLFALILLAFIVKQFLGINGTPGILYLIGSLIIIIIITLNYK